MKKRGFTLIEVLIASFLIFLVFSLIYATFFTLSKTTKNVEEKMRKAEITFNFLRKFNQELKSIVDTKNFSFSQDEISFISKIPSLPYPVKITYRVIEEENGFSLVRIQENLIYDYKFLFPVFENCKSINFSFYTEEGWNYIWEKETLPQAIGLEINIEGEELFFPVKLPEGNYEKK